MRKLTSVLLLVAMLLSLSCIPAAAAEEPPKVSFTIRNLTGSVEVIITANEATTNGKLELAYYSDAVLDTYTIQGVATGTKLEEGKLTLGYAVPSNKALQSGDEIAVVIFTKSGVSGTAAFDLTVKEFNELSDLNETLPTQYCYYVVDQGPTDPGTDDPGTDNPGTDQPGTDDPGTDQPKTPIFEDVPNDFWGYEAVTYTAEKGYFKGVDETHFAPSNLTNRAMFVTVLGRLANAGEDYTATSFTDVISGSYYERYVNWGTETGVVKGISETSFAPGQNVTREQMAAFLYRYATYAGLDTSIDQGALDSFTDAGDISPWAADAVAWAVSHGIMQGVGGNRMAPTENATRAQVAQVIMNFEMNLG